MKRSALGGSDDEEAPPAKVSRTTLNITPRARYADGTQPAGIMTGVLTNVTDLLSELMALPSPTTGKGYKNHLETVEHWLTNWKRMTEQLMDQLAKRPTSSIYKDLTSYSLSCLFPVLVSDQVKVRPAIVINSRVLDLVTDICLHKPHVLESCFWEVLESVSAILWSPRGELGATMFDSGVFRSLLDMWREVIMTEPEDPVYLIFPFYNLVIGCSSSPEHKRICVSLMTELNFLDVFTTALEVCSSCGELCKAVMWLMARFLQADRFLFKSLISSKTIQLLKNFQNNKQHEKSCLKREMKRLNDTIHQMEYFVPFAAREQMKEYLFGNLFKFCRAELTDEMMNLICEFAIEGYRVSQQIDCMDYQDIWCAAEVLEVDTANCEIKVHYIGWDVRYDERISVPSARLAPAFSHTGKIPSVAVVKSDSGPTDSERYRKLIETEPCLGAPSNETLSSVRSDCNHVRQDVINHLRFLNRDNLSCLI